MNLAYRARATAGVLLLASWPLATAQAQFRPLERLQLGVKLTSQAYGLPFRNLGQGLRNLGAAVEADYAYNNRQSLRQTLQVGVQSHHEQGTLYYVNTQVAYRPTLLGRLQPGVALGIGRAYAAANPKNPYYEQRADGSWHKSRRQYRGHWQAPLTLSLAYQTGSAPGPGLTPFVEYQFTPLLGYNDGFPVLPYGLLAVGARFRLPR